MLQYVKKQTNVKTKIKLLNENAKFPVFSTEGSAGADVTACLELSIVLKPNTWALIPTGLSLELPKGTECQIRPRSGLALKYGVTVLNAPATIDSDYRGEVKVLLINHGDKPFAINNGDRIAQFVFSKYIKMEFDVQEELQDTERGEGGFGSTGIN